MPNQIIANTEKVIEQETIEKNTEQEKTNSIVNEDITIKEETESKNNSEKITPVEEYLQISQTEEPKQTHTTALQVILIIASIILAIFLIFFLTFTIVNTKSNKIISNIFIQNYDISNLTQEDAVKKMNNIITSQIPEEITLKHNDYETSISTKELNIQFDTTTAVNDAYKIGRTGNLLQNDLTILETKLQRKQFSLKLSLDTDTLKKQ